MVPKTESKKIVVLPPPLEPGANPSVAGNQKYGVPPPTVRLSPLPTSMPPTLSPEPSLGKITKLAFTLFTFLTASAKQCSEIRTSAVQEKRKKQVIGSPVRFEF